MHGGKEVKIKAVDIAKKLNLSKATVSLALNNKPGVSPATRDAIYQCIAEMEEKTESQTKKLIKNIVVLGMLSEHAEMDLSTDAYEEKDRGARQLGYTLGLTYVNIDSQEEIMQAIRDANEENVAGVILSGTEMKPEQFEVFRQIRKPMVVEDNYFGDDYHCTVIDNVVAVCNMVDLLVSRGCRNLKYLGNSIDIYNFRERKAGFRAGLRKNRLELKDDSIVLMGKTIDEVYKNMLRYLQVNKLPDAFIMDNYQVSIGVMKALKELNISVPRDVSLVGVDELPSFVLSDYRLTTMNICHVDKSMPLLFMLDQEIKGNLTSKFKIMSHCELQMGNSIR